MLTIRCAFGVLANLCGINCLIIIIKSHTFCITYYQLLNKTITCCFSCRWTDYIFSMPTEWSANNVVSASSVTTLPQVPVSSSFKITNCYQTHFINPVLITLLYTLSIPHMPLYHHHIHHSFTPGSIIFSTNPFHHIPLVSSRLSSRTLLEPVVLLHGLFLVFCSLVFFGYMWQTKLFSVSFWVHVKIARRNISYLWNCVFCVTIQTTKCGIHGDIEAPWLLVQSFKWQCHTTQKHLSALYSYSFTSLYWHSPDGTTKCCWSWALILGPASVAQMTETQWAPTGTVCWRSTSSFPGRPVDFVFGFQGHMLWDKFLRQAKGVRQCPL